MLGLIYAAVAVWSGGPSLRQPRAAVALAWVVAVLTGGWSVQAVIRSLDRDVVESVAPWWAQPAPATVALVAVGVLGWWAAGADPLPGEVRARRRSTGRDRDVSSIIYIAEREWSSVAVMLGVAVLAAEVFDSAWPYQSITCVVLAVLALDRSWVRVSVDSSRLTLSFAFPGAAGRCWPSSTGPSSRRRSSRSR